MSATNLTLEQSQKFAKIERELGLLKTGHCGYCYGGLPSTFNPDDPDSASCKAPRWLVLREVVNEVEFITVLDTERILLADFS